MNASGMVAKVAHTDLVSKKTGKPLAKTSIQLLDDTIGLAYLTLWGGMVPGAGAATDLKPGDRLNLPVRQSEWTDAQGKVHPEWTVVTPRDAASDAS